MTEVEINAFPGYTFDLGKSHYKDHLVGEGGFVYAEPGIYNNVALLDVTSLHPTSIEVLDLFGPYTKNFSALKNARVAIKHGDYEAARKMFDGRLAPYLEDEANAEALSYALKIVINSIYGYTSATFPNLFLDRRNKDNIVAKRGALFMIDLLHAVKDQGFQVAHIKTDSIKIPDATPEIIQFVHDFGKKYGYDFEHEATYERFGLVNDAVYLAKYGWAEKAKKIGTWEAVGAQFQHPYVYKTMVARDQEITLEDHFETKQVTKGTIHMDFNIDRPKDDEINIEAMKFVGRIGRFVPVKEGGAYLYRVAEVDGVAKAYSVAGTKGYQWLEADHFRTRQESHDVDTRYYEELVKKAEEALIKVSDEDRVREFLA